MKNILTMLLLGLSSALCAFATPTTTATINYTITLQGDGVYNAGSDTTTFTYTVVSGTKPAISHWVLGIGGDCGGSGIVVASNDSTAAWVDQDKTTGNMSGIKFDTGYNDAETRTVTLTLAGKWETGTVAIAVKSGNGFVTGTTRGPICATNEVVEYYTLDGMVFFDVNSDAIHQTAEPGIKTVSVTLLNGNGDFVSSTTTSLTGTYSFLSVPAGNYEIRVGGVTGMAPSTMTEHVVTVAGNTSAPDTGFALDFSTFSTMSAGGFTIGFWKNNLEKALKGTTKGVQVNSATLNAYTAIVSGLALSEFSNLTMSSAVNTLSSTSSTPASLLAKQLLASEYNYANGAYLNGNEQLTYFFIYYGEYVLQNAGTLGASVVLSAKDWFDAYNNTHGGLVLGPTN